MRLIDADLLKANIDNWYALVNEWGQTGITLSHDDIIGKIDNQPTVDVLDKIRAEIAEYKDDKVIHYEQNEMIDIVLDIIDKYREGEQP